MKRAFLLSEQGVVNIYFIKDQNPRIQWLIDLGIPNFTVFMLELPIPEDNPVHIELIFHEGMALVLEQIRGFLALNEFGEDGGLLNSIVRSVRETEISFTCRDMMYGYEILFPLTREFFNKVVDRMVRQKTASKELEKSKAVWKAPSVGGRYVPITPMAPTNKSQKLLEEKIIRLQDKKTIEDARKIIQRYKNNIYKNTPGPLYVTLYDRNGMPRGVSRVTNKGLTKWAHKCKTAEEMVEIAEEVLTGMEDLTEGIKHPRLYQGDVGTQLWERLEKKLNRKLEVLGKGSSRLVLALDQHSCVKLARNKAGIAQNKAEYRAYKKVEDCSIITRIFYYASDYSWLICERTSYANSSDWRQYGVSGAEEFVRRVVNTMQEDDNFVCPDPVAQKSLEYLFSIGVDWGDINSNEQWGAVTRDGERYPVLVDYGLTEDVWNKHYSSKQAKWDGHINGEFWLDGKNPRVFVDCGGDINHEKYALAYIFKDKKDLIINACKKYIPTELDEHEQEEAWEELSSLAEGTLDAADFGYTLAWGAVPLEVCDELFNSDYDLFKRDVRVFFMKHYGFIRIINYHFEAWEWTKDRLNTISVWLINQVGDTASGEQVMLEQWKGGHKWVGISCDDLHTISSPGTLWRTRNMRTADGRLNSQAFKTWFAGSKIVDDQGNPLVATHTTPTSWDTFDKARAKGSSVWGPGIYLSLDKPWNTHGNSVTLSLYVRCLDPLDLTKPISNEVLKRMEAYLGRELNPDNGFPLISLERKAGSLTAAAKMMGFDGILHEGPGSHGLHLVVFEPNQIKSATDNSGNFDPEDGRITAATSFEVDDGDASLNRYIEVEIESQFGNWKIAIEFKPEWIIANVEVDSRDAEMTARGKDANELQQDIRQKMDWHYHLLARDLRQELAQGYKHKYTFRDLERDNARVVQEMLHEIGRRIDPKPDPAETKRRWPRR